jgi:hypothetical protein
VTEKRFALVKSVAFQSTEPLTATPQITARAAGPIPRRVPLGVAMSAYRVEGVCDEDSKDELIWDRFAHTPGKITNNDIGEVTVCVRDGL